MTQYLCLGLHSLAGQLQASGQRALVVLSGAAAWARAAARDVLSCYPAQRLLWIGDHSSSLGNVLPAKQVQQVLGEEYLGIVYDAQECFDADVFAAACGTVRGGGVFVLLLPPDAEWSASGGRCFNARFMRLAMASAEVYWLDEQMQRVAEFSRDAQSALVFAEPVTTSAVYSEQQQEAIAAICHVVHGHRRRPLVITADRGRGKSAALGAAAVRLLAAGAKRILVTAPRLQALHTLFKHAQLAAPAGALTRGRFECEQGVIEFIPPDVLIAEKPLADCLMIDEAAALPNHMLELLLKHYARLIFASTVHGYEGTGRGFALRFFKTLDAQAPGWRWLTLNEPVRWSANDPLETFTHRALLLDSDVASGVIDDAVSPASCVVERVSAAALAQDEEKLRQLFGLLVLAHYRTRPSDLQQLLDSTDLQIFCLRSGATVLGVALVVEEGRLDSALQHDVYLGQRRLAGHLLAQTLLAHLGVHSVGEMKFARVMRLAIHPQMQSRGLGAHLLAEVVGALQDEGVDLVGATFGLTPQIMSFWLRAGFSPVRVGLTKEHTTGCHSGVFLRPLSASAQGCFDQARERFFTSWPYLLREPLQQLDVSLIEMLTVGGVAPLSLTENEKQEVGAFAYAARGYEMSMPVLHKLVWRHMARGVWSNALTPSARALLIAKVAQHRDWAKIAHDFGFVGKQQAIDSLRQAAAELLAYEDAAAKGVVQ